MFEDVMAVATKCTFFLGLAPCNPVEVYRRFIYLLGLLSEPEDGSKEMLGKYLWQCHKHFLSHPLQIVLPSDAL
jgi:hypothetical protein